MKKLIQIAAFVMLLSATTLLAALNPRSATSIVDYVNTQSSWVLEERISRSQPETWRLQKVGKKIHVNVSKDAGRKASRQLKLVKWSPTYAVWGPKPAN